MESTSLRLHRRRLRLLLDSKDINVKVGDKILHDKYAGTEFKDEGEEYLILSYKDILAILA